jgi:hypothetical protein
MPHDFRRPPPPNGQAIHLEFAQIKQGGRLFEKKIAHLDFETFPCRD